MYIGFCSLFTVLSMIGLNTLLQLARLRSAWGESARAMNAIKSFISPIYRRWICEAGFYLEQQTPDATG